MLKSENFTKLTAKTLKRFQKAYLKELGGTKFVNLYARSIKKPTLKERIERLEEENKRYQEAFENIAKWLPTEYHKGDE